MASPAIVTAVTGHAWILNRDGSRTELHPGSQVPAGSEIVTAANSQVQMTVDGKPVTIGAGRDVAFNGEMATPAHDASQAHAHVPNGTDSDRLLQALNNNQDPLANLPVAGAVGGGAGAGGAGGSSDAGFVVLDRISVGTSPLGWGYPASLPTIPVLDVPPGENQQNIAPDITFAAGTVPTEETSDALTLLGTQYTPGQTDTVTADFSSIFGVTVTPGSSAVTSTTTTYSLSIGNTDTGLTSHGVAVLLSLDASGDIVGKAGDTVVFTISLNGSQVSLHQIEAIDHNPATPNTGTGVVEALAGNSVVMTETVTATDANGNTSTQSAHADIGSAFAFADDTPQVSVALAPVQDDGDVPSGTVPAWMGLETSDANLPAGTAHEGFGADSVTGSFASLFSATFNYGADQGPGESQSLAYSLSLGQGVTQADSGLQATNTSANAGGEISLVLETSDATFTVDGQQVTVHAGDVAGVDAHGNLVFTVSVSNDSGNAGDVTLTQYAAILHGSSPADSGTGVVESLAASGISLVATGTITDDDGDTATSSAQVSLGSALQFADDSPIVTVTTVDAPLPAPLQTSDANLFTGTASEAVGLDQSSADFHSMFASTFTMGADTGPNSSQSLVYSLSLGQGVTQADSGLQATSTSANAGGEISLVLETSDTTFTVDGQQVTVHAGEVAGVDAHDNLVFTVDVSNAAGTPGVVTLTQYAAIDHVQPAEDTLATLANSGISLVATGTITDDDGDTSTASASLSIGSSLTFADDTPQITVNTSGAALPTLETSDAFLHNGNAVVNTQPQAVQDEISSHELNTSTDSATVGMAGLFTISSENMGADGGNATPAWSYALGVGNNGATDLTTTSGSAISLVLETSDTTFKVNGHNVTVSAGEVAGVDASGHLAFTIGVDGSANVTLTQYEALAQPGQGTGAVSLSQGDLSGLVTLTGTATVTDGDGDQTSSSATADITGAISFADDVPTITVSPATCVSLTLETSDAFLPDGNQGAGGVQPDAILSELTNNFFHFPGIATLNTSTDSATVNVSGLFNNAVVHAGADGVVSATTYTYSLSLGSNGATEVATNLMSGGQHVWLVLDGGVIKGETGTDANNLSSNPVFTISVNNAGNMTLTQLAAIDQPSGQGTTAVSLSQGNLSGLVTLTETASVTDRDGDVAQGSASVDITGAIAFADDVPMVSVSVNTWAHVPTLETSDANLPSGTSPESVGADQSSADFSGLFLSSFSMGADDGSGSSQSLSYSLSLTNDRSTMNSGLSTEGSAITLKVISGTEIDGVDSHGNTAFTVTVNSTTGQVTLTQYEAIDHSSSHPSTGAGVLQSLAAAGINLTATGTITDDDGDTRTASATANIGASLTFADDTPAVTVTLTHATAPTLQTSDANLPSGTSPEAAGADHSSASFSSLFASTFTMGADNGPGSSENLSYSLSLTNGRSTMNSGLSTEGSAITLKVISGSEIDGVDSHGHTAFTVTVNSSTGQVTLTQYETIDHSSATPNTGAGVLQSLAAAGINLTATGTITDDDGDSRTASATANIGASLTFADDTPVVTVTLTNAALPTVETSDANLPSGTSPEALGADHSSANFSSLFAHTFNVGADNGLGSSQSLSYSLSLTNGQSTMNSGLSTEGSAITLKLVSGTEIDGIDSNGHTAFKVVLNSSSGQVTLTQYEAIDHSSTTPNTGAGVLQTLAAAGINLTATGTVTDDDGDTRTASATANIGAALAFADDTPVVTVTLTNATLPTLETSDANLPSGTAAEAVGADQSSANFSSLFAHTFTMGADNGQGSSENLSYSLSLGQGVTSASSGLSAEGSPITLKLVSGSEIEGVDSHGNTAFTVLVNSSTGQVTLTQYEAIDHNSQTPSSGTGLVETLAAAGISLTATGTITDDDGDTRTASASVNIGGSLAFADDAPVVAPIATTATEGTPATPGEPGSGANYLNLQLVLDISGSMGDTLSGSHESKLAAMQSAVNALFTQYGANAAYVKVDLVTFSTTAHDYGWMTLAQAEKIVDGLTATNGNTNYSAAMVDAYGAWTGANTTSGTPFAAGASTTNMSIFISDGQPNTGDVDGNSQNGYQIQDVDNVSSHGTSLSTDLWGQLQSSISLDVQAIAIGTQTTNQYLVDIAGGSSNNVNTVTDLSNLEGAVVGAGGGASPGQPGTSGTPAQGSIFAPGYDSVGADQIGAHISAVTIDGVTYSFNGTVVTASTATTDLESYNASTGVLTVATASGTLTFGLTGTDFGQYTYTPSTSAPAGNVVVGYTLTDGDGDSASSTLTINVIQPLVLNPDTVVTNDTSDSVPIDGTALLANDTGLNGATLGEQTVTTNWQDVANAVSNNAGLLAGWGDFSGNGTLNISGSVHGVAGSGDGEATGSAQKNNNSVSITSQFDSNGNLTLDTGSGQHSFEHGTSSSNTNSEVFTFTVASGQTETLTMTGSDLTFKSGSHSYSDTVSISGGTLGHSTGLTNGTSVTLGAGTYTITISNGNTNVAHESTVNLSLTTGAEQISSSLTRGMFEASSSDSAQVLATASSAPDATLTINGHLDTSTATSVPGSLTQTYEDVLGAGGAANGLTLHQGETLSVTTTGLSSSDVVQYATYDSHGNLSGWTTLTQTAAGTWTVDSNGDALNYNATGDTTYALRVVNLEGSHDSGAAENYSMNLTIGYDGWQSPGTDGTASGTYTVDGQSAGFTATHVDGQTITADQLNGEILQGNTQATTMAGFNDDGHLAGAQATGNVFVSESGNDTMLGNLTGNDTFILNLDHVATTGTDVISNFQAGSGTSGDVLDLSEVLNVSPSSNAANSFTLSESAGNTTITFTANMGEAAGHQQSVELQGVTIAQLNSAFGVTSDDASHTQLIKDMMDQGKLHVSSH